MKPEAIAALRHDLPSTLAFLYYPDRESPWLLARRMRERARVAELKAGETARLLERPLVKPMLAAAAGGTLERADVDLAAMADRAIDGPLSKVAAAGVAAAFEVPWYDFEISLGEWASEALGTWSQTSRHGNNLVLQLGFPSEDVALLTQYVGADARKMFEYRDHPVRRDGRPTLAWVRIDIEGDVALIEEIQSDWLRFAARVSKFWLHNRPLRQFTYAVQAYETVVRERHEKLWPKVALLATLGFLRDVVGVRQVFMHQPEPGAALKGIYGAKPPASLYTKLPKSFGFTPTMEAPPFLARRHRRRLAPFRRAGQPVFWQLAL